MTETSANAGAVPTDLDVLYGQTPTPKETPSLIEESMRSFSEMLEMDKTENSNWLLAEKRCPHECRDEFKLIFLRCEVFRVELAVKRYIRYWDNRLEIFGPERAFLPILDLGPNGAMKDNHKDLQLGYGRYTRPGTCQDPDGRVICFLDGTKLDAARNDPDITQEGLLRASWYSIHYGLLSESAQRKGIIVVLRPVKTFKSLAKSPAKFMSKSIKGAVPVRVAAIHIFDPPVLISWFLNIARSFIGKTMQKRMHIHSSSGKFESLAKYGLGREHMPKEMGGDVEYENVQIPTGSEITE